MKTSLLIVEENAKKLDDPKEVKEDLNENQDVEEKKESE